MRITALALMGIAIALALLLLQRSAQAADDRENQPADSNDVVVVVAAGVFCLVLGLSAVVSAVLS